MKRRSARWLIGQDGEADSLLRPFRVAAKGSICRLSRSGGVRCSHDERWASSTTKPVEMVRAIRERLSRL